MAELISFQNLQQKRQHREIFDSWVEYFSGCEQARLLQTLIFERENNYPMRSSQQIYNRLKYKALVRVLDNRAQTQLFKNFVKEFLVPHSD